MVRGVMRLIYYLILAWLVYLIIRFFQNLARRTQSPRPKPRLSGMMVKDEACDTYIPKEEALREVIDGREYFFCSKDCRKKFLEQRKRPN